MAVEFMTEILYLLSRIVFELFMDEVPRIAQDIRTLFTGNLLALSVDYFMDREV